DRIARVYGDRCRGCVDRPPASRPPRKRDGSLRPLLEILQSVSVSLGTGDHPPSSWRRDGRRQIGGTATVAIASPGPSSRAPTSIELPPPAGRGPLQRVGLRRLTSRGDGTARNAVDRNAIVPAAT